MSECNIYTYMFYSDKEKLEDVYAQITSNNLKRLADGTYCEVETISKSGQLIILKLFSGSLMIRDIADFMLLEYEPHALLIDLYTDSGNHTRRGYLEGKKQGYKKVTNFLGDKSDAIAIQLALAKGNRKTVEELLENGVDINLIPNNEFLLWQCNFQDQGPLIITLINAGANVNAISQQEGKGIYYKYSPLMAASYFKKVDVVKALLAKGANVKYVDSYKGTTALHVAVSDSVKSRKICKLLLDAGADPNSRDLNGDTPFIYGFNGLQSKDYVTTIKVLEKYGAKLDHVSFSSGNLAYKALLESEHFYKDNERARLKKVDSDGIVKYLEGKGITPVAPDA